MGENAEFFRIVGDLENNLNIIAKQKSALAAQLNDVKALCDNEARERQLLLGKYRNLEHELDGAKEALDEEVAGRENILRLNAKAEGDAAAMRQKYEQEAVAKAEELEMTRLRLPLTTSRPSWPRLRRPRASNRLRSTRCPPTSTRPRLSTLLWRGRPSSSTRPSMR